MFGDTLVPIDGSRSSRRALRIAAAISGRLGGRMDVVCFSRGPVSRTFRRHVQRLVEDEVGAVPRHVEVDVQQGPAERQITSYVRTHPAQLVCMAAHGRSRSPALLGTVTEAVTRSTQRPVLLVGPSVRTVSYDPGDPVLLASGEAGPTAIAEGWSAVFGGDVFLTTPERAPEIAANRQAAVIVAQLDQRSVVRRLVHGSRLAEIIHDSHCPVMGVDGEAPGPSVSAPC